VREPSILGVTVSRIDKEGLLRRVASSAHATAQQVLAYVNVHALNLAVRDEELRRFLNGADVAYCDGEGVRLAGRILGTHFPPRIVLTYVLWDICAVCATNGLSVFLLGSHADTLADAVLTMKRRVPGLTITGTHHGHFPKEGPESDAVVDLINAAAPDVLFVGFGMPLQEMWIQRNRQRLLARCILPCGSMIDYAAGRKSFAPAWMADHGLEWFFRLLEEPRRLWRRYLLGNPLFLLRVLRQWSASRID
jgi:N-acetylglucosaminyldiphosphoundecaprenol N-acetyl-beta-D-mannosaminyltransferase